MSEEVSVTVYRIRRCGLFDDGGQIVAGSFAETIAAMAEWVVGKTVRETSTFEPSEDSASGRVYALGCLSHAGTGSTLLATWNQLERTGDDVLTIGGDSQVGSATVGHLSIPEGSIPGCRASRQLGQPAAPEM